MYQALIFDFDGVIFDSERWWSIFEHKALDTLIPTWTAEDVHKLKGRSVYDTYDYLQEEFGLEIDRDEYLEHMEEVARNVYENCEPVPGVLEFFTACQEHGLTLAIGSSSKRTWIEGALAKWNIQASFEAIVTSDDIPVGQGKPHPAIYLKAAEKIGKEPKHCIVIEDAAHGIASAKAAGMYCIGLKNDPESKQDFSEADMVEGSFGEINLEKLR